MKKSTKHPMPAPRVVPMPMDRGGSSFSDSSMPPRGPLGPASVPNIPMGGAQSDMSY
jgi:hypothetical protein